MRIPVVLIADDIGTWVKAQAMALQQLGYKTVEASNLADANKCADEALCDLALIDLRLVDDSDDGDTSGISVCNKLPPGTVRVLLTGHAATANEVKRWIQEEGVHHVLEKRESAARRREQISVLLGPGNGNVQKMNFALRVHFVRKEEPCPISDNGEDPAWTELARSVQAPHPTGDEVSFLFHRLLPSEIALAEIDSPLPGGASGAGVVRATVHHRGTFLKEHVIIKFGGNTVDREAANFKQFVEPCVARGFAPRRWSATSRNLSAVAYWYIQPADDSKMPSFAEYVKRKEYIPSDGPHVITWIFSEVCKPWFDAYREKCRGQCSTAPQGSMSLRRYFMERLWPDRSPAEGADKLAEIVEKLKGFSQLAFDSMGKVTVPLDGTNITTRDVTALVRNEHDDERWPPAPLECVTHGDLHARNIFIVSKEPWIIDFGDCGWGHPFRDFVALEISLRFGVLYDYSSLADLWTLERSLATQCSVDFSKVPKGKPKLQRAAELVSIVREQASHLNDCVESWERQYAIACMFRLLKLAGMNKPISGLEDESCAERRRLLAFLAAGAVAEGLGL